MEHNQVLSKADMLSRGFLTSLACCAATCFSWASHAAPGNLDLTFGGTGMMQVGFGHTDTPGQAMTLQNDGKIVMAGLHPDPANGVFEVVVARFGTNNLLDPTFGSGGTAAVRPPFFPTQIAAVAIQPDGKIVVAGSVSTSESQGSFLLARFNSDGSIDGSFGSGGIVLAGINGFDNVCSALALQPDGAILTAGTANNNYMVLARVDTNGVYDSSFGSFGIMRQTNNSSASSMTLQPDGKILVGGFMNGFQVFGTGLFRFNSDGSTDTSFGSGGHVIFSGSVSFSALSIQPAGVLVSQPAMILAAGRSGSDVFVARLSLSGALDTTFNGTGMATLPVGTSGPTVTGLILVNVGTLFARNFKPLVCGYVSDGTRDQFFAVRFNNNGSPDTTLGGGGLVTASLTSGDDKAYGLAIQAGFKILLAGTSDASSCSPGFGLARFNWADGSPDTNFNRTGILTVNLGDLAAEANAVAIQSDGKILIAGHCGLGCGDGIALCRFNPDGTLETTFGSGGKLVTSIGSVANSILALPDGRFLIAGAGVLARFLSNGSPDPSFGTGGAVGTTVGTNSSSPYAIALQADGKIVLGAQVSVGTNDLAVLRYNSDGSLDTNFNGTGQMFVSVGSHGDSYNSLAVQSDGRIVSSGASTFTANTRFSMFRSTANGLLDPSFGASGRVTTQVGTGLANTIDGAFGMVLQPDGRIVLAGLTGSPPAYQYGVAVVRYNPDGSLDTTFGSGGRTIAGIGLLADYAVAVGLESRGKLMTACRSEIGNNFKFAAARFLPNGTLDSNYGFSGVNYFDFGTTAAENANAMAIDSAGRAVIVGTAGNVFGIIRVLGDPVLRITSITRLPNGHMLLRGLGVPGASHTLQGTPTLNPANYSAVGSVTPDASATWQYEDTATGAGSKFYRLSYP